MTIEIRPAVPSDAAQILTFITELAEYEKARHEVIASVADIQRSLFSEGATAHGLICLRDGLPNWQTQTMQAGRARRPDTLRCREAAGHGRWGSGLLRRRLRADRTGGPGARLADQSAAPTAAPGSGHPA